MEPESSLLYSQAPAPCPYLEPTPSSPHNPWPTSWRYILILASHLRLGLSNGLFPSGFPTKTLHTSPFLHTCHMPRPSHSSRFFHPHNIGWAVQIIKLLIMYFSPLSCYPIPLRPKYSPQYPVIKHSQPMFLSQCQRPSLIQNGYQKKSISIYKYNKNIVKGNKEREFTVNFNCNNNLMFKWICNKIKKNSYSSRMFENTTSNRRALGSQHMCEGRVLSVPVDVHFCSFGQQHPER